MPTVDHKLSLTPTQQLKLNEAKAWGKRNWKPFVTGAAVAYATVFIFRGRSSAPITIINNIQPVISPEKLVL